MSDAEDYINGKVPLLPDEDRHEWNLFDIVGCHSCITHPGAACVNCERVVDGKRDVLLFEKVQEVIHEPPSH